MVSHRLNRLLNTWANWFSTQRSRLSLRRSAVFSLPTALTFGLGLVLALVVAACNTDTPSAANSPGASPAASNAAPTTDVVRFAYQKSTILLRSRGTLEKRLEPAGVKVEWTEFPAGPQLLEALNAGAIDIGPVGESPPIFAQAAGADLVYAAATKPTPKSSAVLVLQDSPIKTIADLKGKKVAFQKGSSANYLLVQLLEKAGLQFSDIEPINLPPADARVALVQGEADAWVVWDPFYAAAESDAEARAVVDGEGVTKLGSYYIASRKFSTENADVLKLVLEEVRDLENWSETHRDEVAKILAPVLKLDLEVVNKAIQRRQFGAIPIDDQLITEQQKAADTYAELKLIPKQISIKDATLTPEEYAAIAPS